MDGLVGVLEDWIGDCTDDGDPKKILAYIQNDQDRIMHAIFTLCDERTRYPELFESTVRQLFTMARSKESAPREFVLLFAPSLLFIYLSAVSMGDKKSIGSVELVLLSLYNMEVLDEQGQPRIAPFRLPSLARQSLYHEPDSLAPASFTMESLQRLEVVDTETVRWGPPTQMTVVTASTRQHLATAIMVAYNAHLAALPKIALMYLCKSTSRIVCQGFNRPGHHQRASYGGEGSFGLYPRPVPRIPVTSEFLMELLHGVYFTMPAERSLQDLPPLTCITMPLAHFHFNSHNMGDGGSGSCPSSMPLCIGQCYHSPLVKYRSEDELAVMLEKSEVQFSDGGKLERMEGTRMMGVKRLGIYLPRAKPPRYCGFNEFASLGIQALEDVHVRAQFELYSDVLLMTNAVKNSLNVNPSGQPSDGPMGISVALTPSTGAATVSKSFITNASFRTKKLPEDIPIQPHEQAEQLTSIKEDQETDDKDTSKPIRPVQGSGRDKDKGENKDVKDKEKEGKEKGMKFTHTNIPLPGLVKRRDKEKNRNGDRRDSEKKSEKKNKHDKDKDKENRNGTNSNRNSATLTSDSDGGGADLNVGNKNNSGGNTNIHHHQQQQQVEMKPLNHGKSPCHHDGPNASTDNSSASASDREEEREEEEAKDVTALQTLVQVDVNGGQNHVTKVM